MELRHLRYFLAVAEEQTFSRAAKRLNITQPPLTRQIRNLEDELGVVLFERGPRRVQLTAAGRAFLPKARATVHESLAAMADARRSAEGYGETISVGFMSSVMLAEFPAILSELHARMPALDVKFRQMRSPEQWEAMLDGLIDVGFVDLDLRSMTGQLRAGRIVSERFLHQPLCLAVAKGHRLEHAGVVSLAEVKDEPFAILERHLFPSHHDKVMDACRKAGFNPRIVHLGEQVPTLLAYVGAGLGVCLAPGMAEAQWGRYVSFLRLRNQPYIDIHMIAQQDRLSGGIGCLREIVHGYWTSSLRSRRRS